MGRGRRLATPKRTPYPVLMSRRLAPVPCQRANLFSIGLEQEARAHGLRGRRFEAALVFVRSTRIELFPRPLVQGHRLSRQEHEALSPQCIAGEDGARGFDPGRADAASHDPEIVRARVRVLRCSHPPGRSARHEAIGVEVRGAGQLPQAETV